MLKFEAFLQFGSTCVLNQGRRCSCGLLVATIFWSVAPPDQDHWKDNRRCPGTVVQVNVPVWAFISYHFQVSSICCCFFLNIIFPIVGRCSIETFIPTLNRETAPIQLDTVNLGILALAPRIDQVANLRNIQVAQVSIWKEASSRSQNSAAS